MKKIVIVCGLIAGFITGGWTLLFTYLGRHSFDFDNGVWFGYASMIMAFSLVFVGVKNHRDNNLGGYISFGKALQVGLLIVLIASTIYVVTWLFDYYFYISNFAELYTAHELAKLKASGASQAQITKQAAAMAEFTKMYKNPFYNAMLTYTEILPVGLIVAVIAALILKKKKKVADLATA